MSMLPTIIQGGMGAGVSSWRLARAVSSHGQLGVVSGTALDQILARRLQDGDPGRHIRRSLERFPFPAMARRVWDAYHIDGGKFRDASYVRLPMFEKDSPRELIELCVVANFVEVDLAREGHAHPVGINYLEKIQMPHLASIFGAMLAGVDFVLMGAGIPVHVPDVLEAFAHHEPATYPLHVIGAGECDDTLMRFDPLDFAEGPLPPLERPLFVAIIASNVLAVSLLKKTGGRIDGFVIEGPTAGGHNAPPRGKLQLDAAGEAVYGERDKVDLAKIRELNRPFWLAGGYGSPEKLREALATGATGVQVGTAFAYCVESGLRDDYKRALLEKVAAGTASVFSDPQASPTNFPFKVARLEGTLSERDVFEKRPRICDLGFLREAYLADDGEIAYRCSAEPPSLYVSKGGTLENTRGRVCICNALMATVGLQQVRKGRLVEAGIVTSGNDLSELGRFMPPGELEYRAADVLDILLVGAAEGPGQTLVPL